MIKVPFVLFLSLLSEFDFEDYIPIIMIMKKDKFKLVKQPPIYTEYGVKGPLMI